MPNVKYELGKSGFVDNYGYKHLRLRSEVHLGDNLPESFALFLGHSELDWDR
jgi:hypothetical protein